VKRFDTNENLALNAVKYFNLTQVTSHIKKHSLKQKVDCQDKTEKFVLMFLESQQTEVLFHTAVKFGIERNCSIFSYI